MLSSTIAKTTNSKKIKSEIMQNLSLEKIKEIKELFYLSLENKNDDFTYFNSIIEGFYNLLDIIFK